MLLGVESLFPGGRRPSLSSLVGTHVDVTLDAVTENVARQSLRVVIVVVVVVVVVVVIVVPDPSSVNSRRLSEARWLGK